jgi:hypothetical protein
MTQARAISCTLCSCVACDQEITRLKRELYETKLQLWQHRRPHGYDPNGRTFSDTFGLCSHRIWLLKPCAECEAGSGRPVPP